LREVYQKLIALVVSTTLWTSLATAQIGGIAGTKLAAFMAEPLPIANAEFEPTFNYGRSLAGVDSDSIVLSSNMSWRFSYGLTKDVELGFNSMGDFSSVCLSSKVKLYSEDQFGLSAMTGIGLNLGNLTVAEDYQKVYGYGAGLISTYDFNKSHSLDFNLQYYRNVGSFDSMIATLEYGTYSIIDRWLFVIGLNLQTTGLDPILTLNTGVSIETAESYAVVLNPFFTLYGADINTNPQSYGFALSITGIWGAD